MNVSDIPTELSLASLRLLTTKRAAHLLGVSTAYLERDRWAGARNGQGATIPYVQVGARAVRYRLVDLHAYIESRIRSSTSDQEPFGLLHGTWPLRTDVIFVIELMEEVDRTVSHMKDEAANYPDPSDRASQEEEFSLELRTRDRERKLIKKIDNTIDLIDQDDYGYCESCGIEIGVQRLEARPTASKCIDCKTLDEMKEKQLHG